MPQSVPSEGHMKSGLRRVEEVSQQCRLESRHSSPEGRSTLHCRMEWRQYPHALRVDGAGQLPDTRVRSPPVRPRDWAWCCQGQRTSYRQPLGSKE